MFELGKVIGALIYYVEESFYAINGSKNAFSKARDDASAIIERLGLSKIEIERHYDPSGSNGSFFNKLRVHRAVAKSWKSHLSSLSKGDTVVIQFPPAESSSFTASVFDMMGRNGVEIVLVVHDMETFRESITKETPFWIRARHTLLEEHGVKNAAKIIVHNPAMLAKSVETGVPREKLVSLDIFDYLMSDVDEQRMSMRKLGRKLPVIIAGNLKPEKAGYCYQLPENIQFNMFGNGFEGAFPPNAHYHGSFLPDELPYQLTGSFGLVWDGTSSNTCSGVYGEYLRINNPHKTSLYLASGIPVAIWRDAALAQFVLDNNCGIVVDSIAQIADVTATMSDEEYKEMCQGASEVGKKMRKGAYLTRALTAAGVSSEANGTLS